MSKIKFGLAFMPTDDEGCSDYVRCNKEEPFIQDYLNGRWLHYFLETLDTDKDNFEKAALALMDKQDNEEWVTGYGYVDKSKITVWLKIKGFIKHIFMLRFYCYKIYDAKDDISF